MVKARGVFGGTAGLWLVRKKHRAKAMEGAADRSSSSSAEELSLSPPLSQPEQQQEEEEEQVSSLSLLNEEEEHAKKQSSSSWIAGDKERGRPMTANNSSADADDQLSTASSTHPFSSSLSHSSEDEEDCDSVAVGKFEKRKMDPSFTTEKKEEDPIAILSQAKRVSVSFAATNNTTKNARRRGVFGGRNRKRGFVVPVTQSRESLSSIECCPDQEVDLQQQQQQSKKRAVCASSSTSHGEQDENAVGDDESAACSNGGTSAPEQTQEAKVSSGLASSASSHHRQGSDNNDSSIFDFETSEATAAVASTVVRQQQQPGHHTSLDVARAFFEKIDADPSLLTLEQCDGRSSPTPRKPRVGTTRGKLPRAVAEREYQNYCTACRDSRVRPLPMRNFLEQRSEFFRAGEVFEGMFDD